MPENLHFALTQTLIPSCVFSACIFHYMLTVLKESDKNQQDPIQYQNPNIPEIILKSLSEKILLHWLIKSKAKKISLK